MLHLGIWRYRGCLRAPSLPNGAIVDQQGDYSCRCVMGSPRLWQGDSLCPIYSGFFFSERPGDTASCLPNSATAGTHVGHRHLPRPPSSTEPPSASSWAPLQVLSSFSAQTLLFSALAHLFTSPPPVARSLSFSLTSSVSPTLGDSSLSEPLARARGGSSSSVSVGSPLYVSESGCSSAVVLVLVTHLSFPVYAASDSDAVFPAAPLPISAACGGGRSCSLHVRPS